MMTTTMITVRTKTSSSRRSNADSTGVSLRDPSFLESDSYSLIAGVLFELARDRKPNFLRDPVFQINGGEPMHRLEV